MPKTGTKNRRPSHDYGNGVGLDDQFVGESAHLRSRLRCRGLVVVADRD
jgi:hypothetical protein